LIEKRSPAQYLLNTVQDRQPEQQSRSVWTKRAGIIAFLFFLGKGLAWLGLAVAGAYFSFN